MNLIISNQAISTHNGFFSLNDLHKASGGNENHRPTFFMRNQQTQDLIQAIEKSGQIAYYTVKGGNTKIVKQGTFVCREIVIAYGMWISAKFHLSVIRAFDELNTGAIPCLARPNPTATAAQKQTIKDKIHRLSFAFRHQGSASSEMYNLLRVRLRLSTFDDISSEQIATAHAILDTIAPNIRAYDEYRRDAEAYALSVIIRQGLPFTPHLKRDLRRLGVEMGQCPDWLALAQLM